METKRVIVIGGGLSGLTAAYRIQTDLRDVDVTVLEANPYPGGRMLTTDFGAEAGGESIGFYYGGLHELAKEMGVEIDAAPITILNKSFNLAYYFEEFNEWVEQKDWANWENNPLPPHLRNLPPIMLLRDFAMRVKQPDFDELLDDPQMKKLAGQSLLEFLRSQEAPDEILPFVESNFEINDDLSTLSAFISILKTWITQPMADSKYYFIKGGNQSLPKALCSRLKRVHFNKKVASVRKAEDNQHEVRTTDGTTYLCDYVIFAIPAGPMQQLEIAPPLEGLQKEAFDQIRYTPSVKVFYKIKKRFWEEDGLPIFMWTDTAINFVIPVYDKDTRENPLTGPKLWGLYTISNGTRARQLYEAQEQGEDIAAHCQSILVRIRPSMKDALETVQVVDWGNNETALGAFHYFEPNERILDYYRHIAKPSDGRYFACEHTEYKHKGFEAATQAGLRAAREVCKDIVGKRVLIIGCGNLGSVLAEKWQGQFYDTRVTTTTPAKRKILSEIADDVRIFSVNDEAENMASLEAAVSDRDVVVCLVGPVPGQAKTPQEIHAHYTENLLQPARIITDVLKKRAGTPPHLIFASSLSVYGTGDQTDEDRLTEEAPTGPTNPSASVYDATEKVYLDSGLPVTILRFGALYDRGKNAFANQAKMAIEKMSGMSPFDPEGIMNKIGIWDAANAIDFVANGKHYGVFNLCDQEPVTVQQFFDQICQQHDLGPIQHLGMIKGVRKEIACDKISNLGFRLTPPHVLVIGSGELSTHFVTAALKRGYRVTMTTTTPAKVDTLLQQYDNQVEVLIVEGGQAEAIAHAMEDKDVVVVAVAPKKERLKGLTFDENFYQVFSEAYKGTTQNVVKAWQQMEHRPQVIYVSAHTIYPDTDGGVVDESTYPLPRHRVASILSDAEATILDWIPGSIALRMSWLLSPRRNWKNILSALSRYEMPGTGKVKANMVHIEDAANSILFGIENELKGIYNVCNDAHPHWRDLWEVASHHLGTEAPTWNDQIRDEWFEGDHVVSNQKIKDAGFRFKYPNETGLSFIVEAAGQSAFENLQSGTITAWARAIETKKPDGLLKDPYAEYLSNRPNLEFLTIRARLIDDAIVKGVSALNGECQIVILGAGMDTRAFRLEALSTTPVFEIDLPLVVATKKQFMAQHDLRRDNYIQLGADLADEPWPVFLKAAGYRETVPTIWIAEGLLAYLDSDAGIDLLTKMNAMSAFKSAVIADIPTQTAQGRSPRIRFTCDNAKEWLEKSRWPAVESIEPDRTDSQLQQRFASVNQYIRIYRAAKQKRVCIIGCGYFGSRLLQQLNASGRYQVSVTTTTPDRTEALIAQEASEVLVWDGTDADSLGAFIEQADVVVVSLRALTHDNAQTLDTLKRMAPMLQPSQHLIHMSSIEVYPGSLQEVREEDASSDKIQYAMEEAFAGHSLKCTPRIAQLYGPGEDHRHNLRNMKGHVEKIRTFTRGILPGDGSQSVHLTHVQDLVDFTEFAIEEKLRGSFNLCKTLSMSRRDFYEKLCEHYGTQPIRWSAEMEGIVHMMLPLVIHTDRLGGLHFSLDEKNYDMEFLLEE